MAKPTRRHIVTGISVLYLLALTVLATYSLHQAKTFHLPVPNLLCALTIALPTLAGVSTEALLSQQYARRGQHAQRAIQSSVMTVALGALFLIGETALATLSGTHLGPASNLKCGLQDRWQAFWHAKDGETMQRIQDAFNCCGLVTTKDRAFPFPDKDHKVNTCEVRYERMQACLGPWMGLERKVAGLCVGVVAGVFAWQLAMLLTHTLITRSSSDNAPAWFSSAARLPAENSTRSRPAIGYRDIEEPDEDDSIRNEVTRLNSDSNLASRVESGRSGRNGQARSPLMEEHENWRE